MTIRAVILGLLGAMFIAGIAYINDHVWQLTQLVAAHFPVFVFGSVALMVLLINPVLFLVRRSWRLRSSEIAVTLLLMLVVCSIPNYGLCGTFTKGLAKAAVEYRKYPGWEKNDLRQYVPPQVLPARGEYVPEFADSFLGGSGSADQPIGIADVPWHYWQEALVTWIPMVVLLAIAVICLGLIVHRQWTTAERLRYPIADVASSLIGQDPDRMWSPLFRRGVFWTGLSLVLFIRVINGIAVYFPEDWIQIPLSFEFYAVIGKFPSVRAADMWWWAWLRPTIYPTIIAIAFMLASDVSLSLGLAPIIFAMLSVVCLKSFDVNIGTDDYMLGGPSAFQRFGSYLAMLLMVIYTGRRYYSDVLLGAFGLRRGPDVPDYALWACRFLMVALAGLVLLMTATGLDWPFAILCVFLIILIQLGLSRINCESGMFLNLPRWQPLGIIVGLFGAAAVGPKAILLIGIVSVVFTIAPWESLMPFFMNGLRVCSNYRVRPARAGVGAAGVYVLGLIIAVPVVLWALHNFGVNREPQQWSTDELPTYFYRSTNTEVDALKHEAELVESVERTTNQRLWEGTKDLGQRTWRTLTFWDSKPDDFVLWAGLGIGVFLLVSMLRLRLPWWPLHPVLFMVWGTRQMSEIAASFFLGWLIKTAVTNLGGSQTYQRTKSLMFGIIAGDLLGGVIFMIIGLLYYLVTNKAPNEPYMIFPIMR